MSKCRRITVSLPHLTPTVTLPRHLAKTLTQVIASGADGISTLELTEVGCLNPAKAISALKKLGAMIESARRDAEDSLGEIHSRVAHYTYCGWLINAHRPQPPTLQHEDSV